MVLLRRFLALFFLSFLAVAGVVALNAEVASADEWTPEYGYDQPGKEGDSTAKAPFALVTDAGKAVVVTTGDTFWVDPAGQRFDFVGQGTGQLRGSILIVVGPEPANVSLIRRWSWIGVTSLPDDKLSGYAASRIINTRLAAFRDPANGNGGPGKGLTGPVDVAVVRYGLIQETRVIYPGQWAAEK